MCDERKRIHEGAGPPLLYIEGLSMFGIFIIRWDGRETVLSYSGNPYTGKTTYLYWDSPLNFPKDLTNIIAWCPAPFGPQAIRSNGSSYMYMGMSS